MLQHLCSPEEDIEFPGTDPPHKTFSGRSHTHCINSSVKSLEDKTENSTISNEWIQVYLDT